MVCYVAGKIQNSSFPYSVKCPTLLPRKQNFMKLVIRQCHENVNHNGVGETLAEIPAQFGIIKGRQAVKDLLPRVSHAGDMSVQMVRDEDIPTVASAP